MVILLFFNLQNSSSPPLPLEPLSRFFCWLNLYVKDRLKLRSLHWNSLVLKNVSVFVSIVHFLELNKSLILKAMDAFSLNKSLLKAILVEKTPSRLFCASSLGPPIIHARLPFDICRQSIFRI